MRTAIAALVGVTFLLAGAASCLADDQIDNPEYQTWCKFKPGTTLTTLMESESDGQKTQVEFTSALVEVAADKLVLQKKSIINANGQRIVTKPGNIDVPAKIDSASGGFLSDDKSHAKITESTEELDVAGTKVKCKLVVSISEFPDSKLISKTWTSDQVPGHTVQSETTLTAPSTKTTTTTKITAMTIK